MELAATKSAQSVRSFRREVERCSLSLQETWDNQAGLMRWVFCYGDTILEVVLLPFNEQKRNSLVTTRTWLSNNEFRGSPK